MPELLLTTQPGWAFAIVAELRRRGLHLRSEIWHRDSTLVIAAESLPRQLRTPADACGVLASVRARGEPDATSALMRQIEPARIQDQLLRWLPSAPKAGLRRYSLTCETWGRTA